MVSVQTGSGLLFVVVSVQTGSSLLPCSGVCSDWFRLVVMAMMMMMMMVVMLIVMMRMVS